MKKADCTKDTELQESNVNKLGSKTVEDTKTVDKAKPQTEQDVSSTQSAKNNSHEYPVPAFKDNIEIDTENQGDEAILAGDKKTDRCNKNTG